MNDNFDRALAEVLKHEGGYVNHPKDPGGETNLGVTRRTYEAWTEGAVSSETMRALTVQQVAPIYEAWYWRAASCDRLPDGVDLITFDAAVNQGPARARRWVQRAAGVREDGMIGPVTLAAVKSASPRVIIDRIAGYRLAAYRSLATWETFGRGWSRRLDEIQAKARSWAE